jgi:hypothetical protein
MFSGTEVGRASFCDITRLSAALRPHLCVLGRRSYLGLLQRAPQSSPGGVCGRGGRSAVTWEKQVLSARGFKRVGRPSQYPIYVVWRCIGRGPGGSSEPSEPRIYILPGGHAPHPASCSARCRDSCRPLRLQLLSFLGRLLHASCEAPPSPWSQSCQPLPRERC